MKVPGFTLLELLFCMALVGIVLSLGAKTYQVFQGMKHRYMNQVAQTYQLIQFQDRLRKDFEKAIQLEALGSSCIQLLRGPHDKPLQYCLSGSTIIRSYDEQIDTFRITGTWNLSQQTLYFQDSLSGGSFIFQLPQYSQAKINRYEGD